MEFSFFFLVCHLNDPISNIPNSILSPMPCRSASCECEMCISEKANGGATDAKPNRMKRLLSLMRQTGRDQHDLKQRSASAVSHGNMKTHPSWLFRSRASKGVRRAGKKLKYFKEDGKPSFLLIDLKNRKQIIAFVALLHFLFKCSVVALDLSLHGI